MAMLDNTFQIIIPARYESRRFPGKPLALINGIPMIIRVAQTCSRITRDDQVLIATDDVRIHEIAEMYGFNVTMSSASHQTGTDRVAECSQMISRDFIINVQGDEPLITGEDILTVANEFKRLKNQKVVFGYCSYQSPGGYVDLGTPKVVKSIDGKLLYISRNNVPANHLKTENGEEFANYLRQVCIYAFNKSHLLDFSKHGKRTPLELLEDIEVLRFLELGHDVYVVETGSSIAVDFPEDIKKVEDRLRKFYNLDSL